MRIKMFAYLAFFTAIVLAVIAAFQILLLDKVYRATVIRQSKAAAETISAIDYNSEDFRSKVYDTASKYGICVTVYKVGGSTGTPIVTAHTQSFCLIHSAALGDTFLSGIYANAKIEDVYTETLEQKNSSSAGSLIAAKVTSDGNYDILTVVNSDIKPVDATVATLRWQLLYLSAILLVVSAVMAFFISKKIAVPVSKMNEEAKKLAGGNYDVDFEGGAFRETVELGNTLNYAAGELSKLDTMQKELIANISHDLRTPLTMISGYSEVMRDIPGEMTAENMQIIIDETKRLSSLVNDMLDLSRLTGGKRELKKTLFSLTEAVRQTVERYSRLTVAEGYSIEFAPDREVYVEADEILILQVIYNLVSNAVNYTSEDKKVYITQTLTEGICRISVSDTGDGIPEEKLPLIWDRYYRTGDYHKRAVTGTGLGLSIVKNALLLHGASFGVSSSLGEGSTFWFELKAQSPKN
ncbi:MAG: HAMP domain-containing sensor histidine kinase [Clostridia bacterium]|nr:HAMP domain-containing sensor histidine kinase [Clostridia bacterium]